MTRQNYHCLISLLQVLSFAVQMTAQNSLYFDQISEEDGLIDARVQSIFQDDQGFMWFGNIVGLNRYDGREIRTFALDPDQPDLVRPNQVLNIFQDREGRIWMHGDGGLLVYHPQQEQFERMYEPKNPGDVVILSAYVDKHGNTWVGTTDGLMRFDPGERQFLPFSGEFGKELKPASVRQILEDSNDNLWFSYPNGLYQFSWQDTSLTYHPFWEALGRSGPPSQFTVLYEDSRHNLWAGTSSGLYRFVRESGTFVSYPIPMNSSGTGTGIDAICEASDGTLWLGSFQGLFVLDPKKEKFTWHQPHPEKEGALRSNMIRSIYRDSNGDMWIGTGSAGVFYWSPHREGFNSWRYPQFGVGSRKNGEGGVRVKFESQQGNIWAISDHSIRLFDPLQDASFRLEYYQMIQDRKGGLWTNAWAGEGLSHYDASGSLTGHYRADSTRSGSLTLSGNGQTSVPALLIDHRGEIWAGVQGSGLYHFVPEKGVFNYFSLKHPQIPTDWTPSISTLFEDSKGNLWIGTWGKWLIQLNPDREIENIYDFIFSSVQMHEDAEGRLWIGSNRGLYQFDPNSGQFQVWRTKDGLPHNRVYFILEDERNRLWLGTQKGLSCFDPKTETFKNYDPSNGLPGLNFGYARAMKDRNGTFYFGANEGILYFHPDSLRENPNIPPVLLTSFKIGNKEVPIQVNPGNNFQGLSPLSQSISHTKNIRLQWFQNDLSFEFVALNYLHPEKNQYQYRLKSYSDEWIGTNASQPFANYTNLDPGQYTFQVKAANNDGVWNEDVTSLNIRIFPPWWRSFPAKIGYGLAFLTLLLYIRYLELRKQKHRLAIQKEKLIYQEKVNAVTSKFVPDTFIHALGRKNIMDVQLGDAVAREVTVMFSDIRDYTTLAESMSPEENFRFVSAFNQRMGPVIQANKGFVNQYLGDALMALFDQSAFDCLCAGIQMQEKLTEYNQERKRKKLSPIRMGIGLHSGQLIMGIIGDEKRMDAATISDTVNTASRIESLTKYFDVKILLSEESVQQVQNRLTSASSLGEYYFRYLGEVQLKGKKKPTKTYECFNSDLPVILEKKLKSKAIFQEGMDYYFSRQFTHAVDCFEEVLTVNPGDGTARLFRDKASRLSISGVQGDWTGVEVMTFK